MRVSFIRKCFSMIASIVLAMSLVMSAPSSALAVTAPASASDLKRVICESGNADTLARLADDHGLTQEDVLQRLFSSVSGAAADVQDALEKRDDALQEKYEAQVFLNEAQENLEFANRVVSEAEDAIANCFLPELTEAQEALEEASCVLKNAEDDKAAADAALADAQGNLAEAEARATKAQREYDAAMADAKAKGYDVDTLAQAREERDELANQAQAAQERFDQAITHASEMKAAFESSQLAYENALQAKNGANDVVLAAQLRAAEAGQKLSDAQSALENIQAAGAYEDSEFQQASHNVDLAQGEANEAQVALDGAIADASAAEAAFAEASEELGKANAAIDEANLEVDATTEELTEAHRRAQEAQDSYEQLEAEMVRKVGQRVDAIEAAIADLEAENIAAQNALSNAKKSYDSALVAANKADQEVNAAKTAADKATATLNRGAIAFFESIGATNAVSVLKNPSKVVASYQSQGSAAKSSQSWAQILESINLLNEINNVRAKEKTSPLSGKALASLKVDPYLMATAMLHANASAFTMDHMVNNGSPYGKTENLAWGYKNPYDGWYTEEKAIWDSAKKTGKYTSKFDGKTKTVNSSVFKQTTAYGVYTADYNFFEEVGHYLICVDSSDVAFGFSVSHLGKYSITASYHAARSFTDKAMTVTQFKSSVNSFYDKYSNAQEDLQKKQTNQTQAKSDLTTAKTGYDSANVIAQQCSKNLQAKRAELSDLLANPICKEGYDSVRSDLAKKMSVLEIAQEQVAKAAANLAYASACVDRAIASKKAAEEVFFGASEKAPGIIALTREGIAPFGLEDEYLELAIFNLAFALESLNVAEADCNEASQAYDAAVGLLEREDEKLREASNLLKSAMEKEDASLPKISISRASISLGYTSCSYTGSKRTPSVSATFNGKKLVSGTDFKVSYSSNINAGTAKVTISGTGKFCGTTTKTFKINKAAQKSPVVTLKTTSYTYDGKAKKPGISKVTMNGKTLVSGTDYSVSYSNNTKVGTATVTVSFKNYSGTVKKTFKINPKGTSVKSLTSGKKSFTVKWGKQATQTSGYQIRYSRYSSMASAKTATSSGTSTLSKKVTGLAKGKVYYVQVRTYKIVNGVKHYSAWSSKKTVRVG